MTKHDLKARPIFHYTERRIRAHLAISYMAYSCVRYLEHKVKKIRKTKFSPQEINRALANRLCIIFQDEKNDQIYGMPTAYTKEMDIIYRSMGVKPEKKTFLISQKSQKTAKT